MSRDRDDRCSGVESSSFVTTRSWRLKDHSRWVFRKNSMEFSIGFDYLLILLYKWLCFTVTWSHVLLEHSMTTWPCHMTWLPEFPCYLYLDPVVWLDVRDQMFKCIGNSFLSGALITIQRTERQCLDKRSWLSGCYIPKIWQLCNLIILITLLKKL